MTKNLLDLLFEPSLAVLHRRLPFLVFLLVAAVPAGALAQPNLDSLSEATLDRSGRLRLLGTGFGAEQGASEVLIDGHAAIVAEWSDQAVNAYVPEAAGPGMVEVRIVTDIGTSNALPLDVTLRQPRGRVRWRFTCDSRGVRQRPGIGPDGTVYAQDTSGIVYAIAPDGALLWLLDTGDEGSEGPVVVGPNGDVYLQVWSPSAGRGLGAYDPFGSLLWVALSGQTNVLTSPDVAPDGRIFAVRNLRELREVHPDGSEGWIWTDDHSLQAPIVSPDGSLLLAGLVEPMQFAGVRAFATSGQPLWEEIFPNEGGNVVFASARPIFRARWRDGLRRGGAHHQSRRQPALLRLRPGHRRLGGLQRRFRGG